MPAGVPALVLQPDDLSRLAAGEAVVHIGPAAAPADGEINAAIDIPASPARVWAVMVDCARAPAFMANLKSCKVLQAGPNGAWDAREHRVQWLSILPEVRSVFRSDYVAETSIRFRRVEGDLKYLDGEWRLEPLKGGAATRLTYEARVGFHSLVPSFMVRSSLESDVPKLLQAIKTEVKRSPRR